MGNNGMNLNKQPLLLLLLVPLLTALPQATAHAACPQFPETVVTVHPHFAAPRYNFQQSLASLRRIAETQSAAIFHRDQPVGLAVGELKVTMAMQANAAVGTDKMICAKPAQLQVEVGFQNSTIYVAREFPRRTCAHNEVLAHEEEHVAIDRELLREYEPIIQRFLQVSVRELGTVRAKDGAAAEAKMQQFISKQLEKVADKMNAERVRRQSAHDSPEEYARLAAVCDGEVSRLVAQYSPTAQREYQQRVRNRANGNNAAAATQPREGVVNLRESATRAPTSRAATQRQWDQQNTQVAPSSQQRAKDFARQQSDF